MDRATLEQQHPALFAQLQTELAASGAAAERQRIAAVLAVGDGLPGHEKLLSTLAYDGKTTPEAAALAVLAAEKQSRAAAIAAHTSDAPPAVKPSAAPQDAAPTAAEASAAAAARAVAAFNAANGVKTHA